MYQQGFLRLWHALVKEGSGIRAFRGCYFVLIWIRWKSAVVRMNGGNR